MSLKNDASILAVQSSKYSGSVPDSQKGSGTLPASGKLPLFTGSVYRTLTGSSQDSFGGIPDTFCIISDHFSTIIDPFWVPILKIQNAAKMRPERCKKGPDPVYIGSIFVLTYGAMDLYRLCLLSYSTYKYLILGKRFFRMEISRGLQKISVQPDTGLFQMVVRAISLSHIPIDIDLSLTSKIYTLLKIKLVRHLDTKSQDTKVKTQNLQYFSTLSPPL